jgi:uncharacterized protein YjbI with pentapeptide repeats
MSYKVKKSMSDPDARVDLSTNQIPRRGDEKKSNFSVHSERRKPSHIAAIILSFSAVFMGTTPQTFGAGCLTPARDSWSAQERWVWLQLCAGHTVDLAASEAQNSVRVQKARQPGDQHPVLRASFVETILLKEPYRTVLTERGLSIAGARFLQPVVLRNTTIPFIVSFNNCEFEEGLDLSNSRIGHAAVFSHSVFSGPFDLSGVEIDGSLIADSSGFHDVNLRAANVSGGISFVGGSFAGIVTMDQLHLGGSLFLRGATILAGIQLTSSRVGGQVDLSGASVSGPFAFQSARVADAILLQGSQLNGELDLGGSIVEGTIDLSKSVFIGPVRMDGVKARNLFFRAGRASIVDLTGAEFAGQVDIFNSTVSGGMVLDALKADYVRIGRTTVATADAIDLGFSEIRILDLSGSLLPSVILVGAKITGELRLSSMDNGPPSWHQGAELALSNATVRIIKDDPGAWPTRIKLDGLLYDGFTSPSKSAHGSPALRDVEWFKEWLGRDPDFSPQPYYQLARVLEGVGRADEARDIRYISKQKEHQNETRPIRRLVLTLSRFFIGYGEWPERVGWWIVGFTFLGWVLLWRSGEGNKHRIGFWYSFDMLIPLIRIREAHYKVELYGYARYYFYFHKVIGFVLASFLVAALAGMTK